MQLHSRQGDLVITKIPAITGELETVNNYVFAGDSSGHPHTLKGKAKMRIDGLRTLVVLAKPSELVHGKPDGHKTIQLEAGSYEVRALRERGGAGDRIVSD
jgi:hypothetical protein